MTVNHGVPGSSPGEGAKATVIGWLFYFMIYIYVLFSSSADKYYVGHSVDPWKRLIQHNENSGSKFTGKYSGWELKAIFEVSANKGDADKIEKFIKRQKSRNLIEKIIKPDFVGNGILALLVRVPHVRD